MGLRSIGFLHLHEPIAPARPPVGRCHSALARTQDPGSVLALADEVPGIDPDIDFHNHVAEASGVRFGLVGSVGRNE